MAEDSPKIIVILKAEDVNVNVVADVAFS